jgi:hypothetical protein
MQMVAMERGKYYMGGKVQGLELPTRVFPCASPAEVCACVCVCVRESVYSDCVAVRVTECERVGERGSFYSFSCSLTHPHSFSPFPFRYPGSRRPAQGH